MFNPNDWENYEAEDLERIDALDRDLIPVFKQWYEECYWEEHKSVEDAIAKFQDYLYGIYDSKEAFAQEIVDEQADRSIPKMFLDYFDYEAYARDLFLDSFTDMELPNGMIAVFSYR